MKRLSLPAGLPLAAFSIFTTVGVLAGASSGQAEGLHYSIGLMAGASGSPFSSGKVTSAAIPLFRIEGERFSFGIDGLTYDVIDNASLTLSARLAPRFGIADPSDVAGLEHLKRDIAVEAGLAASLSLGEVQFAAEVLKDVSNTHDGMAVTATLGTNCQVSDRFSVRVHAGATWMDAKLATYSYGVLSSEARPGLPANRVDDSVVPAVGIDASFVLSDNMTLVGGVSAEFLPDGVTVSPIVKRDTVVSAMFGVQYAF